MIDIVDLIDDLRTQIAQAQAAATGQGLQFMLGPIELEMSVAITTEGSAGGKVRIYVVEFGGNVKEAEVSTQRIKLTLTPTTQEMREVPSSSEHPALTTPGERIYISGHEHQSER